MAGEKSTAEPKPTQPSGGFATGQGQQLEAGGAEFGPAGLAPRVAANPAQLSPRDVLVLQRAVGNQAVLHMLGRDGGGDQPAVVQRRLTVGPVDDRYEQEADEIARQVQLSRLDRKPNHGPRVSRIQRRAAVGPEGGALGGDLESRIRRSQNGGSSLPNGVRSSLESKLNADFSGVKVHTGSQAVQLNRELGAKAFTHRNHIFYGAGQSPSDLSLTAHEAVHTIQQGAVKRKPVQRQSNAGQELDTESQVKRMPAPAVQREIGDTTTDIDWSSAKKVKPSTDGAKGGVMFVSMDEQSRVVHIVKGVRSAASALFAEKMVAEISGAQTTESQPIRNTKTGESKAILDMLREYADKEDNPEMQLVWERNLPFFENAAFLLVQKKMGGTPMDAAREDNPMAILDNPDFLKRMGLTLAADTLIGNADRFESMNTGNAFVTEDLNVGAIDTEAILQSHAGFVEFLRTESGAFWAQNEDPLRDWVRFLVGNKGGTAGEELTAQGYGGAPSSDLQRLTQQFDNWFEKSFQNTFLKNDKNHLIPQNFDWNRAKQAVHGGFGEGLQKIANKFSGKRSKELYDEFRNFQAESGDVDPNFDLGALKVKATYLKTAFAGGTGEDAYASALDMAGGRSGAVEKAIDTVVSGDATLFQVIPRPDEMTGRQKILRKPTRAKNLEKEGKELKKLTRAGGSSPELEQQIRLGLEQGNIDRSAQKALYEIQIKRFIDALQNKAAALQFLEDIAIRGHTQYENPSLDTELAMKRYAQMKQLLEAGRRRDIFDAGGAITVAKDEWLNTLKLQPGEAKLSTKSKAKLETRLNKWHTSLNKSFTLFEQKHKSFYGRTRE